MLSLWHYKKALSKNDMKKRIMRALERLAKMCQHRPVTAVVQQVAPSELLRGKVALITGGTGGIGKAIAKEFFDAGAFVVVTSRSEERARLAAAEIDAAGKRAIGYALDGTRVGDFEELLHGLLDMVPGKRIDILVNNAGLVGGV